MKNLDGKTIVITGATSGIGYATAKMLALQGANVIGVGRSQERCDHAQSHIRSLSTAGQVRFLRADLSLQSEVRSLAREIRAAVGQIGDDKLDGLINNAGIFCFWLTLTPEGFEMQWAVNHLAPFLLTYEVLPLLVQSPNARVVTVSSNSHYNARLHWDDIQLRRRYFGFRAYKQTKLANVLFSVEFNRRNESGVKAFAGDPGLVNTDIGTKSDSPISRWIWNWRRRKGISSDEAARGLVYLVGEPSIQDSDHVYWKHGEPKAPNKYALDPEHSSRLWALSEKMCGINNGSTNRK